MRYFLSENEDIHLCYSLECKHGPGIIRDGKGPPRMSILDRPWETTTDPLLQRVGTWFINENLKTTFLLKHASLPPTVIAKFKATPNYISHFFPKNELGGEIVGLQSFGDLTMNLWNVAFINSPRLGLPPELLFLGEERLNERIYTCLVKWKENAKDAPENKYRKHKMRVSIEDLRFGRFAYYANHQDSNIVQLIRLKKGIADQIEFAVSGRLLIHDGKLTEPREIIHQFSDIRHLLALPNLNPKGPLYKSVGKPLSKKPPRDYFGAEQENDIWFGEAQLLEDRNLRRAALSGPVEFSRLHGGLGASQAQIRAALNFQTVKIGGSFSAEPFYSECLTPTKPLEPGQWRFAIDDPTLVEVWLKRNVYPCSILGVTENGDVVCFAWRGDYAAPGYVITKTKDDSIVTPIFCAADELLKYGVKEAILLDEGNDVRHECLNPTHDKWEELVVDSNNREQARAIFVFTSIAHAQEDYQTVVQTTPL